MLLENNCTYFGRSKSCEFGLLPVTVSKLHGPTSNPWMTSLNSGGSSGGAAAAVASGMVPAAHASDGGGSIRIPAAWCGAVGFKASRGRVPTGPTKSFSLLSVNGMITRSVRDQREIYSNVWTGQYTDSWIPSKRSPLNRKLKDIDHIKIGLLEKTPLSAKDNSEAFQKSFAFANSLSEKLPFKIDVQPFTFKEPCRQDFTKSFIDIWASGLFDIP